MGGAGRVATAAELAGPKSCGYMAVLGQGPPPLSKQPSTDLLIESFRYSNYIY